MIEITVPIVPRVFEVSSDGHLIQMHGSDPTDFTFRWERDDLPDANEILVADINFKLGDEPCDLHMQFKASQLFEAERTEEPLPFETFIVRNVKLAKTVVAADGRMLNVFEPIGGAKGVWMDVINELRDSNQEAKPAKPRRSGQMKEQPPGYNPKQDNRDLPAEWKPRKGNPTGGPPPVQAQHDEGLLESASVNVEPLEL